jgi:hypothetical protein
MKENKKSEPEPCQNCTVLQRCLYQQKMLSDTRYNAGLRPSLQSDIRSAGIRPKLILFISDIGLSSHLRVLTHVGQLESVMLEGF